MNQIGFRDLDALIMGTPVKEPAPPAGGPTLVAPAAAEAVPAPASPRVFAADLPDGPDALARGAAFGRLAELAAHSRSQMPLCIGLLGPAGSGKSFALTQFLTSVAALSAAAAKTDQTPFLPHILVRPIDAATLDGDAATALAGALYEALAHAYPDLAREAAHAVRDPHVAVREAVERLDAVRRQLETERRSLEDADSRRARLVETVLYETPGAQVESYARANRGRIETALSRFGIGGDQMRTYKDLVRMAGESGGGGRLGMTLRTLWGFKGQTKLIVTAVLLGLLGIGLGVAHDTQASWLAWLRASNPSAGPAANWIEAHIGVLASCQEVAWLGAGLAVIANLWRSTRFVQPIFRGATLLKSDVAQRRRDLDTALAHQTRRVDGLTSEAEAGSRRVMEAQRRADALGPAAAHLEPAPFGTSGGQGQAQRFFAAVAELATKAAAPQRIILALDNLDSVGHARARDIMAAAQAVLRAPFLLAVAGDPHRIAEHPDELEKWIQVPYRLDAAPAADTAGLVRTLVGGPRPTPAAATPPEVRSSVLDRGFSEPEVAVLTALAPLAGGSPRAVKRFVNLYRLARLDAGRHPGATALMLALGMQDEPACHRIAERLAGLPAETPFDLGSVVPEIARAALQPIAAVDGAPLTAGALRAAAAAAAPFSRLTGRA